ncbi:MAG: cytolysin immunity CylI protein [Candidatus Angelobacter sp.]|nr:cytolysin immunity CylI protein [Candidatus Angelobacter sp.]
MSASPTIQLETSPTPILDRLKPIPEAENVPTRRRYGLIAAICAVCLPSVLIGLMIWSPTFLTFAEQILRPANNFLDTTLDSISSGHWGGLVITALLPFFLFAVIVIHEIGHLLLGLSVRFRLTSVRFGPVRISPPFRLSFKIEPKTSASGFVSMIPGTSKNLRLRAMIFILGGPLANLLTGATILFLEAGGILTAIFAALSIAIGLGNLIPFRRLALISDGKRMLMLLKNRDQGERSLAILQLAAELQSGVEPENLSPDFIAKATAVKNESPDTSTGNAFAYSCAWHQNKIDEAAQLLETSLEYSQFSAPIMREVLRCDAAVFQARKRKRIDLAEQWLSEIPEKTLLPGLRLQGESAILEAQGNIEGALKKLDEVETALMTIHDSYQRPVSLRFLQRWRRELLEKKASAAAQESKTMA